ncbi:MAG TPA: SURF1 family protein, partial [Tianweitania sediminis]|nr:SURF1 family protein [Tianweitania sediminis]
MTDPSNVPAADDASALSGWRRLALGGLVVAAFALLLVLGTWQVQRMQWKEALLSRIEEQLSQQPLDLAEVEAAQSRGDPIEYQPVTLSGQFEHERERHFFATHEGQSGFYVYTPLRLADGRAVFVNRGFVPFDLKSPSTRPAGQVAGTVSVTGLAREQPAAKPSWLVPENDPAKNIFYWKDLGAMASSAAVPGSILPFFVDADATSSPGGWPVGGVTMVNLPNNHLQYAVTWYGLALALAAVSL